MLERLVRKIEGMRVSSFGPPLFTGFSSTEDPQDFIDHIYKVLRVMHAKASTQR